MDKLLKDKTLWTCSNEKMLNEYIFAQKSHTKPTSTECRLVSNC